MQGAEFEDGENPWYEVVLIEGRNRQIRRMFEKVGHLVEKIRRVRGPAGPLSPRGAIPADAVRLMQSDRWSSILGKAALITVGLAVVLFVLFKILLMSGATSLSGLVAGQ